MSKMIRKLIPPLTLFFSVLCLAEGNGTSVLYSSPFEDENQTIGILDSIEPLAFETFSVAYLSPSHEEGVSVDINIENNLITIRVLTVRIGFTVVPPFWQVISFNSLPAGDYTLKVIVENTSSSSHDYPAPWKQLDFSISEGEAFQAAYTFYHSGIDHYFVTTDEAEADLAEADEWYRADSGFNVWPADGPAPDAALPVCRFYSTQVNSHFYTASEEECDYLQSFDSDWEYEGIAFRALVPTAGACATGTTPVWRLYNNRAHLQDSNHRFVASSETYRTMIADGWLGEGVAFCSPPSASE